MFPSFNQFIFNISGVPLGRGISTQERNYGPLEQPSWTTHSPDKDFLKQYFIDNLDLELELVGILHIT
jgi:hypothetical protein